MTGHGAKFARKMEAAISALLTRPSIEDAARVAGVAEKTLRRWMQEPEFDAAYRAAKRAAYGQAIARLHQGSGAAAATLLKLMVDSNVPASTRARCADSVLGHTTKAIELEDIEARLAALEQATEESQK